MLALAHAVIGAFMTAANHCFSHVGHFGSALGQFRDDPAVARFGSPFGVDMSSLVFLDEQDRPSPADRLGRDAWSVRIYSPPELAERYRRALPVLSTGTVLDSQLITAHR
jgi:hypothetical protein